MEEPYRVEVLHIVNPHLIFVESQIHKGNPVIQQVGIFGVLPVYKTIDIDGNITAERCENWSVAANTILREILAEYKNHVYFVPVHVDERSTIFDENIHQFGDIIIRHRTMISLTEHITNLVVAVKDEPTFFHKLANGSLKLRLNTGRTEEVLTAIKKYYKKQRKVDHDWKRTIEKQTSLHQESKKIIALTEANLKLLDENSQVHDAIHIKKAIEQKEKDLNLCKDADLEPVGRGSRRHHRDATSATSRHSTDDSVHKPHEMFSSLKEFLGKHGKKKQQIESLKFTDVLIHSTPNQEYKKQPYANINTLDSDEEWDSYYNVKMRYSQERKNEPFHQKCQENINKESPEQDKIKERQKKIEKQEHISKEHQQFAKSKQKIKQPISEVKEIQHGASNKTTPAKPKEHRLVYCPDMEMNTAALKNFVTISVPEDSAINYANIKEVLDKKTAPGNEQNSYIGKTMVADILHNLSKERNKIEKNAFHNLTDSQKSDFAMKPVATVKLKCKLDISDLDKKMQALESSQKNNDLISSNSDLGLIKKIDSNYAINTKTENEIETKMSIIANSDAKNIRNSSFKANRMLSNSMLQKKLEALKEFKQRKDNSSSTSDTSVKDTRSSTEQSNIGLDDPDQVKLELEPLKVETQAKLAENVEKVDRHVNPFKNLDNSKSIFVEKLVSPILMVHTKKDNLILPQCEIRDVPFKPDIRMMLKSMRVEKPKRLQMVTWGYILRGHSMFIIGPAGNGKTVGYVPAICNLVMDSPVRLNGIGPICIIVCATALSVSEIENYCKRFLSVEERIVTFFPGIDPTNTATALLNGCHVLICTAPALLNLLETDFGVDLRRLTTLVFDDCERLDQVYTTEITRILQHVQVMLKNRADKAFKVQYIVASRQWCDFMTPLAKKAPDTVIAIGASQECALYSKTKTSVNILKNQASKVNAVSEFLEEIDRTKRTVIVCRQDEEVVFLENILKLQKHVVFSCNSTMDLHELCRLNEAWANYEEPILGPILVCCDGNLSHLNITNANYLVHFSMPPLFSMFCKRFSVLNENYASIFGPEKENVRIKTLLDETNVEQLPKILHFVKRCTKETFPNLDDVLQKVMEAKDLKKGENLTPLCNNLLMLGECADMWNCSDRHTAFKEFDEPKDWMPKQGLITFKITHYDSAVTYSARVLAKITKSGPIKYPNNYNTLSMKMNMYYSKEMNRKLHGVPKVGDICAVALKQNFFERCLVMKVIPTGTKNINHVLINLIDEEQMTVVSDVILYYLPDDLKAIETHVVKVRLANIQPKDRDVTFSLAAKEHLQQITDREREHGLYIRGQVVMTLGKTIFVDTAEACVDLSSLGETVMKRDFKQELLDRHAESNPQHIQKLKELKKASGMIDKNEVNEPKVAPTVKKCPKWAHLDKDEVSTVIFSAVIDAGTIFLRQAKFQNVVDSLIKDINEYVKNAPEVGKEDVVVGNFVLAEFPDDVTYERVKIDEIVSDDAVNCFFVDNGDWRQVAVNKLKPMTESIMHRIPFQAIECRLVGVKPPGNADAWPEFSTSWLDDNCFENRDGSQKQLFAKYFTREKAKVTGGHKYGVVLFDKYSEEDIVINKMMIELNLAKLIENEENYIYEPLNIKREKISDSSSDVCDEMICSSEMPVTDLVPLKPELNEDKGSTDIPLHILLGKPIRSVPLVNSDNESDICDRWDVNVDKGMMGMFSRPSKSCSITEHKDTTNKDDDDSSNIAVNSINESTDKERREIPDTSDSNSGSIDIDIKNEKTDKSGNKDNFKSSISLRDSDNLESPLMSPSLLDSDDVDIGDKRIEALDVFRSKISKKYLEKRNKPSMDEIKRAKNDTLDSDDISEPTETSIAKVIIETVDPPRKPKLVWRQTKNTAVMKIMLIGVEDYSLEIKERSIRFKTWHNDTNYEFQFELYGVVLPEKCTHSNKGQYILVRLIKMLFRNWLSLTKDFSTKKWIVYDVDAVEFSSEEEEDCDIEAREVIKHNHEKVDTSSEDEDFAEVINFKYKRHS